MSVLEHPVQETASTHADVDLTAARAEALFASDVSTGTHLNLVEATAAVARAIRAYRGVRGCAGYMAATYADRPDLAAHRMRWARREVESLFPAHR